MRFHHTDQAPEAIGPYSQAVEIDGWLFTSGQIPIDPATGDIVGPAFSDQARQVFRNLDAVLHEAGCAFEHVVKATVYLADMADFPVLNEHYAAAMGSHRPARSTVQAGGLPKGVAVEIDLIARLPKRHGAVDD
jgi:2-iminobutanoate/2-iminopropanoate deaminase